MKPRESHSPKKEPKGDYLVGYARTPDATKFGPGNQAARKHGRPKGRENNQTILQRIVDFKVTITLPGGKNRKMGLWEASAWKQAVKAAQGDTRAFNAVNDLAERFGVILFDPKPLDGEVTDVEAQTVEDFFVDWASLNPHQAVWLLRYVLKRVPGRQTVPGRDPKQVRRIDFGMMLGEIERSVAS
jgi:Family of unknown function (DUF5681)